MRQLAKNNKEESWIVALMPIINNSCEVIQQMRKKVLFTINTNTRSDIHTLSTALTHKCW